MHDQSRLASLIPAEGIGSHCNFKKRMAVGLEYPTMEGFVIFILRRNLMP